MNASFLKHRGWRTVILVALSQNIPTAVSVFFTNGANPYLNRDWLYFHAAPRAA